MFILYCILKFIIEQLILVFKRKAILISAFKTGDYEETMVLLIIKLLKNYQFQQNNYWLLMFYIKEKVQKIIKTEKLVKMNRFL